MALCETCARRFAGASAWYQGFIVNEQLAGRGCACQTPPAVNCSATTDAEVADWLRSQMAANNNGADESGFVPLDQLVRSADGGLEVPEVDWQQVVNERAARSGQLVVNVPPVVAEPTVNHGDMGAPLVPPTIDWAQSNRERLRQ